MVEENIKEKKVYQKWWFWTMLLLVIIILLFVFRNDVEAKYKGIDVKYLDDPLYCEQNSDCVIDNSCSVINLYNLKYDYNSDKLVCPYNFCGGECKQNSCISKTCGVK